MTQWNINEIRWLSDRVQWFLNGSQVREQLAIVDGYPSEVRLNIWAPNEGFSAAHSFALQPTGASGNQQHQLEIDYVKVSSVVPLPPAFILFSSALALLTWVGKRKS